jgi:hypothetical protein
MPCNSSTLSVVLLQFEFTDAIGMNHRSCPYNQEKHRSRFDCLIGVPST